MKILSIDIETFSSIDITKSGVYAYAQADDFEILLFGYAFDDDPVEVVDLAQGEELPKEVLSALTDPNVIKTAFNANFERTCIASHFGFDMPPEQWRCTAVHALTVGLPSGLDAVAKALKLSEQKDTVGKNLIRFFSIPCKATKANGGRERNYPCHDPERWQQFKDYCAQDVEVERAIKARIKAFPVLEGEQRLWEIDQRINDRGVRLDLNLVQHAIACDEDFRERKTSEAKELTGLENPNSVSQLKEWIEKEEGIELEGLTKASVADLIKTTKSDKVKRVLRLRQELSKTSVKKYDAMQRAVCPDGRVRGLLQFYGASRTGRWAGRLVQVQNLPRNEIYDLELARDLLSEGHYEAIETLFKSVPGVLSQLIRTALVAAPGGRFIVADFSAIEARVIAWMAGEQWRLDVFASHGKIYEASASQMFKVPIEEITKDSPLRQKGKISELALGYGGGVGALTAMGALKMGIDESELQSLVTAWRTANPNIVRLWWDVDQAAKEAIEERRRVTLGALSFECISGVLTIELPSGRRLAYINPRIEAGKFGKDVITYEGAGESRQWMRIDTYGPKLVENIIQAVARDCLAESMVRLEDEGYKIVMHCHDEVIIDAHKTFGSLDKVNSIMGEPIDWAKGLLLRAEGFECQYYQKG